MPPNLDLDTDGMLAREVVGAIKKGLEQAVRDRLISGYGDNPFAKLLDKIVAEQTPALRDMLVGALTASVGDPEFRQEIGKAVRARLAKILVERFGGELEKQVNTLKSDPATRARLTLAIEEIVKGATA